MKRGASLATSLLIAMVAGSALAADPVAGGGPAAVIVRMSRPEALTDFKTRCFGPDARTAGLLSELTEFVRITGERYRPADATLEISVTDIDMAGEFEPWRGPHACDVRLFLDIYVPRIRLEFRLIDRAGRVASGGQRELRDPLYLTRAGQSANDPLRYEKNLLLDWFQREFTGRAAGSPGSGGPKP